MAASDRVAIMAAVRTPIGRFGGSLASLSAVDLGVVAVQAALQQSGYLPSEVDLVVVGLARQAGCGPNPGRQIAVRSGLPVTTVAYTLNQACASGLAAILQAGAALRSGEARVVVAAGVESMSRVPYLLPQVRFGHKMGHSHLTDAMYQDGLFCPLADMVMGETVEQLAREFSISRAEQDEFAAGSQQRAEQARAANRFAAELVPVRLGKVNLEADEHPRDGVTAAALGRLPTVFACEGTITAGNASGITDGASALVLVREEDRRGEPLAYLEGGVTIALEPERMGLGPVGALAAYEQRFGTRLEDADLLEVNEAFAAQVLACHRQRPLPLERLNVNGGAIALGHPIGCTGNRIVTTLLHEMRRRDARRGLASLCVSGGLGIAAGFVR